MKFWTKNLIAVAIAALVLAGGAHNLGATTTTTTTSTSTSSTTSTSTSSTTTTSTSTLPPGQSASKGSLQAKYITTVNSTTTNALTIFTERNKVYRIDYSWLARETNGANQGKAITNECFAVAENIAGTLTVTSSSCGTAKGNLSGTTVTATTDSGVNFLITVAGVSAEHIDWIVSAKATVNDGRNVTTSTTTTTSTSTSSTTSTSTTTST